jgi:hypothetical protein
MTRSPVNLLLVSSLLFTQLAAAPHLHGADVHHSSPHGSQPHFHVHRFLPAEKTEVAPAEPAPAPDGAPPRVGHDCPYDHDADAVYLPDTAGEPGGRAKADPDAQPLPTALPCPAAADCHVSFVALGRAFDVRPPGPPLYIRHLALLN